MTTQPPTARELDRALREGRSPVSGVAVFGATAVAVLATLPTLGAALRSAMREMLTLAARADVDPWRAAATVAARVVVPLGVTLGAAVVAATAVTVAQTRGAWRRALRTTATERRRREREDEGDPAVKRERSRRMR